MPDVEFLPGDPSGEDEVLDTGPRRPLPRWAVPLGVLVVAALVVTVVARHGGAGSPVATPTPTVGTSTPAGPVGQAVPNIAVSDDYSLVGDERDHRLFALSGSQLFAIGLHGQPIGQGATVRVGKGLDADVELVLDASGGVIWAVPRDAGGHSAGYAEAFDTGELRPGPRSRLPGPVRGAAALDGELYVSTGQGLWRAPSPGAPFEHVVGATGAGNTTLVADAARHRIICIGVGGHRAQARVFRSGRQLSAPLPLPSTTVSLAVVGRTIWAGGSRRGHALLVALDPSTLRAGPNVVHGRADIGLAATGRRSLFVDEGPDLVCLSGSSGARLSDLGRSRGSFASVAGRGFFGTQAALHPVAMGRCPG